MIELHRHLDVCGRISTLLEFSQQLGLEPQSTSLDSFGQKIWIQSPGKSLNDILGRFEIFQNLFARPEFLERLAFEAVEDCWSEGIQAVEFRYSPTFVSAKHALPWEDVLHAFEAGILRGQKEYPKIKVGLICIGSRDFGVDEVARTVDFFLANSSRFIGLDLAGNELDFPCHLFKESFQRAKKQGARITIHAGEGSGPDNVWSAIEELGAERIGHGISSLQDSQLIHELIQKQITLEICPTSNWLTQAVPSLEAHPLPRFLEMGVPVTINTDDPGMFHVSLPQEVEICKKKMGMTPEQIKKCFDYAHQASFILK